MLLKWKEEYQGGVYEFKPLQLTNCNTPAYPKYDPPGRYTTDLGIPPFSKVGEKKIKIKKK